MRKIQKMKRWPGLSLLCMLCFFRAGAIEVVASHKVFYVPDNNGYSAYAEVYWQIAPSSLLFMEINPGQLIAKVKTEITFRNETGVVLQDKYIMQTNPAATQQQAFAQNITELQRYKLPAGKMWMELKLTEVIDSNSQFYTVDTVHVTPPSGKPMYSDVQLLDTVYNSDVQTVFSKNNRQQIPLCANFIDNSRNTLFFYSELYDSNTLPDTTLLIQKTYISRRPLQDAGFKMSATDTLKAAVVQPVSGKFNISDLPSGNYYLNIVLQDRTQEVLASSSAFFQRVSDKKAGSNDESDTVVFEKVNYLDISTTFVAKFTVPQLKAILKMIRPISTPIEVNTINNFAHKPDESYMRYFIYNFWKSRNNQDPKKAWDAYTEKVKEVNNLFRGTGKPGYETERGEIYLKYGAPNERITVESEPGARPYEIWTYNVLPRHPQGAVLLFYRPAQMVGDFELLHSNIRGERRNTAWRSILYIATGSSSQNLNSRAEQYFPGNK